MGGREGKATDSCGSGQRGRKAEGAGARYRHMIPMRNYMRQTEEWTLMLPAQQHIFDVPERALKTRYHQTEARSCSA